MFVWALFGVKKRVIDIVGEGAKRHYTYRAKQAVTTAISAFSGKSKDDRHVVLNSQEKKSYSSLFKANVNQPHIEANGSTYAVPTSNRFEGLNC